MVIRRKACSRPNHITKLWQVKPTALEKGKEEDKSYPGLSHHFHTVILVHIIHRKYEGRNNVAAGLLGSAQA